MGRGTGRGEGKANSWTGRHVRPRLALEALLGGGWKPGCFSWMVLPGLFIHSMAIYWTPTKWQALCQEQLCPSGLSLQLGKNIHNCGFWAHITVLSSRKGSDGQGCLTNQRPKKVPRVLQVCATEQPSLHLLPPGLGG